MPVETYIKARKGVPGRHQSDVLRSSLVNIHAMRELLAIVNLHELRLCEFVVLAECEELDVLICLDQETMVRAQGNY